MCDPTGVFFHFREVTTGFSLPHKIPSDFSAMNILLHSKKNVIFHTILIVGKLYSLLWRNYYSFLLSIGMKLADLQQSTFKSHFEENELTSVLWSRDLKVSVWSIMGRASFDLKNQTENSVAIHVYCYMYISSIPCKKYFSPLFLARTPSISAYTV